MAHDSLKDPPGLVVDMIPGRMIIAVRAESVPGEREPEGLLGPREMHYWREGFKNSNRRREWLAGRVAAKQALFLLLGDIAGKRPGMDQMEILPDDRGGPVYAGPWRLPVERAPGLSIAHTGGLAVAEAAFVSSGVYPGLDLELKDRELSNRFIKAVYSPREEDLIRLFGESEKREWRLRLWCAREAAVKSLRRGIVGMTGRIWAEKIDFETGRVYVTIADTRKDETKSGMLRSLSVQTVIYGSYILAASLTC